MEQEDENEEEAPPLWDTVWDPWCPQFENFGKLMEEEKVPEEEEEEEDTSDDKKSKDNKKKPRKKREKKLKEWEKHRMCIFCQRRMKKCQEMCDERKEWRKFVRKKDPNPLKIKYRTAEEPIPPVITDDDFVAKYHRMYGSSYPSLATY